MIISKIIKQYGFFVLFFLCVAILSLLFLFPFFSVIIKNFSLSNLIETFSKPYLYRILLSTVRQAFFSTLLSFVIAVLFLLLLINKEFKGKALFMKVSYLPFVLPSIVLVLAFVTLFGKNSFLRVDFNILYSLKAVLLSHAFYNFPIIMHSVYQKYMGMDNSLENVAYTLGANRIYTFFHVTLRELRGVVLSSLLLVFMYCFSSFAIVLTLGGGIKNTTLEVEIYKNFKIVNNKVVGTSYAIVSFLIMLFLMTVYYVLTRNDKKGTVKHIRVLKDGGILCSVFSICASIIILMPLIAILYSMFFSRARGGKRVSFVLSLKNVFSHYDIFINTFVVGTLSSMFVVFLSFVISEYLYRRNKHDIDTFVFLPLSFSSIALSQGWQSLILNNRISVMITLSLLHALLAFPLVYRIVNNGVRGIEENTLLSPLTLGASELYSVFRLDTLIIKSTLKKALGLAFALSLGEVSGSLVMSSTSFNTLSTSIHAYISRYNYSAASIVAVILCVIIMLLVKE